MSVLQMSHEDYLKHPSYGASDIIKMSRSFAYYKWAKDNPPPKSRPLVVGSAFHLMLQGHMADDTRLAANGIMVYEGGSSLTKGFKETQEQLTKAYLLDAKEYGLCKKMLAAVIAEPEVMDYLKGAIPEATVMGKYPGSEVQAKVRPDYLHVGRGVSINIKTTTDASESGFLYSARDYGYEFQSAYYCALLSQELGKPFDEVHILVEKTDDSEPCPVSIFTFGDDTIGFARSQIHEIMQRIPEHEKTGKWPKKAANLQTIDMPLHMRRAFSL